MVKAECPGVVAKGRHLWINHLDRVTHQQVEICYFCGVQRPETLASVLRNN